MIGGPFWLKFELLDVMRVLYIRIKMEHIDSNREKKWQHRLFRRSRAAHSVVHGRIWPNFKLIKALMYVIITRSGTLFFFGLLCVCVCVCVCGTVSSMFQTSED